MTAPTGGTHILVHWYRRVINPLLTALGDVLAPIFQTSHDHIMRAGAVGLQAHRTARHSGRVAVLV